MSLPVISPETLTMASKRALRALYLQATTPATTQCSSRSSIAAQRTLQQQTRSQSSSTSAIAYKALHRRVYPLPAAPSSGAVSPAAAVSSILYETPIPSQAPAKKHVLNCLVQNEPGVLSRVSGILAARGFNIDSLVVCSTEVVDLSRMTIVLQGQDGVVEQARRQLEDLVPVWAVLDYTSAPLVQRELLLAKISILGPEYFEELLAHHREMTDVPSNAEDMSPEELEEHEQARHEARDFHPRALAPSEALRLKNQHLETITHLTHQFGGKVLDISTNNCIVEVSAKPVRIDSFMKLIAPFGILESARTGTFYHLYLFVCSMLTCTPRSYGPPAIASAWPWRSRGEGSRRYRGFLPAASWMREIVYLALLLLRTACTTISDSDAWLAESERSAQGGLRPLALSWSLYDVDSLDIDRLFRRSCPC